MLQEFSLFRYEISQRWLKPKTFENTPILFVQLKGETCTYEAR